MRPMRLSSYLGNNHIYLMLYKCHYSKIVDLSRLLSKQINNNTRKKFICKRCLNYFYTQQDLNQHISLCHTHENTIDIMPNEGERDASMKLKTMRGNSNIPSYFTQNLSPLLNLFMVVNLKETNHSQLIMPNIFRVGFV